MKWGGTTFSDLFDRDSDEADMNSKRDDATPTPTTFSRATRTRQETGPQTEWTLMKVSDTALSDLFGRKEGEEAAKQ
jgi:hypothetical protein